VPTRFGFFYGGVVLFLLFSANAFGNSSLLFVIAFLVTVGLISMYLTHSNLENLEILETKLDSGFCDEEAQLKIRVRSRNSLPLVSVEVYGLMNDIPPQESQLSSIRILLKKRGFFQIKRIKFSTLYPFGLFYAWTYWTTPVECFVYPKRLSRKGFQALLVRSTFLMDAGLFKTDFQQDDFLGYRVALPSDSARRIDWRVLARTQASKIKLFGTSETRQVVLNLKEAPGENIEAQLSFLATAIDELQQARVPYGLILPELQFGAECSRGHYTQCLQALSEFSELRIQGSHGTP
jgi:uncharacterized protein (DUF58 family)